MKFRTANKNDLKPIQELAVKSWFQFKTVLTPDNWSQLDNLLNNPQTYHNLLENSDCILCEHENHDLIGMAFLVPRGNPTEIYDEKWCHLRFVSVHPAYRGQKIGEKLTWKCIELAKANNEQIIALHTSEIMASARHIYEKIGFKILREIEPSLGVRYWLYTLELKDNN